MPIPSFLRNAFAYLRVLAIAAIFVVLVLVYFRGTSYLIDLVPWQQVWKCFGDPVPRLTVSLGLIAVARFLFLVREHRPRTYGFAELFVGWLAVDSALLAQGTVMANADSSERLLRLSAGIYLMVRGWDNYVKGYKKAKRSPPENAAEPSLVSPSGVNDGPERIPLE